jgi:hypothetical protein
MDVLGTAIGTGIGGAAVADVVRIGSPVADGVAVAFGCAAAVAVAGLAITRRLPGSPSADVPARSAAVGAPARPAS